MAEIENGNLVPSMDLLGFPLLTSRIPILEFHQSYIIYLLGILVHEPLPTLSRG